MLRIAGLLAALFLGSTLWAQGDPANALPPGCGVEQKEVDEAIRKGAEYLKHHITFGAQEGKSELVIYTLLHAGVPLNDPVLAKGLDHLKSIDVSKLEGFDKPKCYRVALAAMALGSAAPAANRMKLAQYAYFLVANQCQNGQWSYGAAFDLPKEIQTPESPGMVSSGPGDGTKVPSSGKGADAPKKIKINCPKKLGPGTGDNSNLQLALLGLRTCVDAGCDIPDRVWSDALKFVESARLNGGCWGYGVGKSANAKAGEDAGYGSMTASGVADVVICEHFLGKKWEKDKSVEGGIKWLGEHFTVTENAKSVPGQGFFAASFHYYYLYSLERAGMLAATESMGTHRWYPEGARYLIDHQQPDGSWKDDVEDKGSKTDDTCFAILFLGRATKPVNATR